MLLSKTKFRRHFYFVVRVALVRQLVQGFLQEKSMKKTEQHQMMDLLLISMNWMLHLIVELMKLGALLSKLDMLLSRGNTKSIS